MEEENKVTPSNEQVKLDSDMPVVEAKTEANWEDEIAKAREWQKLNDAKVEIAVEATVPDQQDTVVVTVPRDIDPMAILDEPTTSHRATVTDTVRTQQEEEEQEEAPLAVDTPEVETPPPPAPPKVEQDSVDEAFADLFGDDDEPETDDDDKRDVPFLDWMMTTVVGTKADMRKLQSTYASVGEIEAEIRDPRSFMSTLLGGIDYGLNSSPNVNFARSILEEGADKETGKLNITITPKPFAAAFTRGKTHGVGKDGKVKTLVGKAARLATIASIQGISRIKLLNSGFHVTIRPMGLQELSEFANTVETVAKSFGRSLGGHFAICNDIFLKQKFMELIERSGVVVDSNLEGWDKEGTITKYMSVLDYEPLILGVLGLMYRKGLSTDIICPACKTLSKGVLLDPMECSWINEAVFTPEIREWWLKNCDGPVATKETVIRYQTEILPHAYKLTQNLDVGKVELNIDVPRMSDFLEVGIELMNRLNVALHGKDEDRVQQVARSTVFHIYQMCKPWVTELTVFNGDGSINYKTSDHMAIEQILEARRQENDDFYDELNKFIGQVRVTYIGSMALNCPECGAKPHTFRDAFCALDVESIFFVHACR